MKHGSDRKANTFKALLDAKSYAQRSRIDYGETFAPIVMLKSIWILLAIIAYYGFKIW